MRGSCSVLIRTDNIDNVRLSLRMSVCAVTLVCLPLTVGELAYRVWIYGGFLCRLAGFLQGNYADCFVFSSFYNLVHALRSQGYSA